MRLIPFSLIAASVLAFAAPAVGRELAFLRPADIDPAHLLPPPPGAGSKIEARELAELRRLTTTARPGRYAQAKWDYDNEDGTIFRSVIAPGFDLNVLPTTAHLLDEVRNEEAVAASRAKDYFRRKRPWLVASALKTCSRNELPLSSYPSGHTTMAFAMATVLASVAPELASQLMARAADYGESRLICGMHHRSDIVAGQTLGTAVSVQLMHDPRFQADMAAAAAELRAAHLTAPAPH